MERVQSTLKNEKYLNIDARDEVNPGYDYIVILFTLRLPRMGEHH